LSTNIYIFFLFFFFFTDCDQPVQPSWR
jgi:hypothetical protein